MEPIDFGGDPLGGQDPQKPETRLQENPPQEPQSPPLTLRQQVVDRVQQRRQREADLAAEQFGLATRSNPDLRAEAQRIGQQLGVDPSTAERNLDVARVIAQKRAYHNLRLADSNPVLAGMMKDIEFARIAHDNISQLSYLEQIGQQWNGGRMQMERGRLYGKMRDVGLSDAEQKRLAEVDQSLQLIPNPSDPLTGTALIGGQMSKILPESLAAGLATAGTFAAGAVIAGQLPGLSFLPEELLTVPTAALVGLKIGSSAKGLQLAYEAEGGNAYGDMLAQKIDPKVAGPISVGVGLVNMVLEGVSGGILAKTAGMAMQPMRSTLLRGVRQGVSEALARPTIGKAALRFATGYAEGAGGEVVTEVLQEMSNVVGEGLARGDFSTKEGQQGIVDRLSGIAGQTALGMSILALPGPARVFLHQSRQVAVAEHQQKFFQDLSKAATDQAVRERNPQAFEAFQRAVHTGGAERIYVDAVKFGDVLRQNELTPDDIAETMPDVASQMRKAAAYPGVAMDVVMPTEQYATYMAGTPVGEALLPHMRLDPDGVSSDEAKSLSASREQMAASAEQVLQEKQQSDAEFVDSAKRVEDAIHKQIVEAAKGTHIVAKESRAAAQFYRDFVVTQAAKRGMSPEEFHAKYPVRIGKGDGTRTPTTLDHLEQDSYRGGHRPPMRSSGAPLSDLTGGGAIYPDDVYGPNGMRYYGTGDPKMDRATMKIVQAARGNPDQEVTIYRAAPTGVTNINPGDWVTVNRDYAVQHGEASLQGDYHVIERKVRAGDIFTNGDSWHEYGYDPNILHAGEKSNPRGGFAPSRLLVTLNEKADISTALHEFGHAFLSIYGDLAAQGDAFALADMEILAKFLGAKDAATWLSMPLEEQRKGHERFAYSFEGYLFDGVAPSEEMRGLFDRFKVWVRRVYRTIRDSIGATYQKEFGEPLPILTGEVRGVMDRMLASEDAIAEAEAVRSMAPLYQTQEQSGMDDAKWAAYQELAQQARDAGIAELDARSLRSMEWLSSARGRLLKEMQAKHDDVRARVRREVVGEVAARPKHRVDRWLRTGKLLNEDGTTAQGDKDLNHKLDKAAVQEIAGADAEKFAAYVRSDGGLSPDAVAEQFGYDTAEAMLRDLGGMQKFGDAVDARTDERMEAEHSDLADPEAREQAVERALHNEARTRFVAAELRHLQGAIQPVRVMLAAAKEAARQAISKTPLREASPKQFSQGEARAARMAMDAARKGDSALAAEWTQKRLLQHALAQVAGEVQDEVAKDLKGFQKLRKSDTKLAKVRNTDLVNAARWILSRYNLGTPVQQAIAEQALLSIKQYDAGLFEQLTPMLAAAQKDGQDYKNLTVEQFRDLAATVNALWFDSLRSQQIKVDGKLMQVAEARAMLVEQFAKTGPEAKVQPIRRMFGSIAAGLTHVESWALEMDGGKHGPVWRLLFNTLREPVNDFLLERTAMRNEIDKQARKLPELYGRKIEAKELIGHDGKPHVFQNRGELVGWLQHQGNNYNSASDAVARGWVRRDANGDANLLPLRQFRDRMVREGVLTKADFDFAQHAIWDVFENKLKDRAQRAYHDVYGRYFDPVAADSFTVTFPDGTTETYRGGYMPAKADIDIEEAKPGTISPDGLTEEAGEFVNRHPSAPKGWGITRVGADRALAHDIRIASVAFSEELQFIHLQRPGRDIAQLLNDKAIGAAIHGIDPNALKNMFFPWLQDTMKNRLMAPGGDPMVNRALVGVRRNVGLAYMFGNIANGVQQLTGLATSALYVPLKHLRAGSKLAMSAENRAQMMAESKFMALRLDKHMGQITDDIDLILQPTWMGNIQKWTQRHGYFLQQWFQAPVDVITWMGAKDHAIAQGKSNAEAIQWADTAVRRSQGSGTVADISRFERSGAVVRLLTQFGGYWFSQLNSIMQRHGIEQAKATAVIIAFAGVTAGAISQALKGGWDDDDEDGALWDDVAGWALGEAARTGASLVPVVGPMAYTGLTGDRGGRLSPAATMGAAEQGFRGLRDLGTLMSGKRDAKGQDARDLALFLSIVFGVPLTAPARPISYQIDVARGNVQPSGTGDYVRGLLTGAVAPGTKQ